jgi:transposase
VDTYVNAESADNAEESTMQKKPKTPNIPKTPKKHRRKFTSEFKENAVRIVEETHQSMCSVANDLGVAESVLRAWVHNARDKAKGKVHGGLTQREREELNKLRRETKRLRMEHELLKKAAAFFARESRSDSSSS